jgi:hypothetical protein
MCKADGELEQNPLPPNVWHEIAAQTWNSFMESLCSIRLVLSLMKGYCAWVEYAVEQNTGIGQCLSALVQCLRSASGLFLMSTRALVWETVTSVVINIPWHMAVKTKYVLTSWLKKIKVEFY